MILIVTGWLFLVCAYTSAFMWLHYSSVLEIVLSKGADVKDKEVVHMNTVVRRCTIVCAVSIVFVCCFLVLNFIVPKKSVTLWTLGNTTW